MNHSAAGFSASASAPTSSFDDLTARMTPSAPTPKWRSAMPARASASNSISPSGSANSTKSLPVPWPLVKWSAVLTGSGYRRTRECHAFRVVCPDPPSGLVPPEPPHLAPGIAPGERRGLFDRLRFAQDAVELGTGLRVPDRAGGGDAEPSRTQCCDLVDQPVAPHSLDASIESLDQGRAIRLQPDGDGRMPELLLAGQTRAEGLAGDRDDLEGTHQPPAVMRADRLGGYRI